MDAKITWGVWRRILREPELSERLFEPGFEAEAERFGLRAEEVQVAREYASTPKATRFFVTTYRYRMVSSFGHALQSCAPLSYRALRASGQDMRALGERCLDALGWRDMGPHVYGFCAEILGVLRGTELPASVPGLSEVMELEGASIELVRRLAGTPGAWVSREEREAQAKALDGFRFRRTGTGVVVRTERSLTPWLRSRAALGKAPLEDVPETYLVHLPSPEEGVRLTPVGASGGAVFGLLAEPSSPAELEQRAAAAGVSAAGEPRRWLGKYLELGVVAGQPVGA